MDRKQYLKRWREKNKQKLALWYKNNKKKRKLQMKKWRTKNKEKYLAKNSEWKIKNAAMNALHKQRTIRKKVVLGALAKLEMELQKYFNLK